ncbi:DUF4129 domain-containing protein [Paenibacillus hexagrammi]|uniref:DUF4129 domain-containing protein n=1 Tax=Paenibacillus hexagrammi TaxID=2908839 RepID=A0ABY3SHS0_9BACL|nr:DUF4129 domain-containing protein [Paenibacillus sp. YPD9-1]UJF32746.1 DUF4129 domain-containing protein [Paenibacillus sp. YPD9-1]
MKSVRLWCKELVFSVIHGVIELIVYFPLILLAHLYVSGTKLGLTLLMLLACYALGCLGGLTRILMRRGLEYLFALLAGAGIAIAVQGNDWHGWASSVIGFFAVYRGIQFVKYAWSSVFPPSAYLFGFVVYLIGVPIMGQVSLTAPYVPYMNGTGMISLLIFLFHLNRLQLLRATLSGTAEAQASMANAVQRSNRIWLSILIVIIAAIAFFQQIRQVLSDTLRGIMRWLAGMMHSGAPAATPSPAPEQQMPMPPPSEPTSGPTWWDILWGYVQVVIGYLIVTGLVLFILYLAVSKLAPSLQAWFKRLLSRTRYGKQQITSEHYTDEQESLLVWKNIPGTWLSQLTNRFRKRTDAGPSWADLSSNRERVKYLYVRWIRDSVSRGYSFQTAQTPKEIGQQLSEKGIVPQDAAAAMTEAYNQVRYGDLEVNDETVQRVQQVAEALSGKKHGSSK